MAMNHKPLLALQHEDPHAALVVQDQEEIEEEEQSFIAQFSMRAREAWETFHLEYPDIDEETFRQAQRLYVKQWFLQEGILLSDLPAFERAKKHFEYEVKRRALEIQLVTVMMEDPIYPAAQSLGTEIAVQARQRSKQVHDVIEELSNNKALYLVGKIQRLHASGQAQEQEKEIQERVQKVRQDIGDIKASGIVTEYERQKVKLKEREKRVFEQLSDVRQLIEGNQRHISVFEDSARLQEYINGLNIIIEDMNLKTINIHSLQNVIGTVPSDWDAATQRSKCAQDHIHTFAGFMGSIQEGVTGILAKAKAEAKYIRKVKSTLGRLQKRSAEIEEWADDEIIKQEEKLEQVIRVTRSKTKAAIEQLERVYKSLDKIRAHHLRSAEKGVKFVKSLERGKHALEQAVLAAESYATYAQGTFERKTVTIAPPDQRKDATRAPEHARQSVREEMEAYSQARRYVEYAIQYMRDISSEHRKVEDISGKLMEHFTDLLKGYLSFEQDVLDRAITGVKSMVKAAMKVIKLEEEAIEAAHQTTTGLGSVMGANASQFIAKQREALMAVASANDELAGCAASYQLFHKLAEAVAKENGEIMLETSKEQLLTALKTVRRDLDDAEKEKEKRDMERQAATREIEYDPARSEGSVTIKLRKDEQEINLLVAASVITGSLKKEELRELVNKSLNENINCIKYALGTRSIQIIEESFEDAKIDDIYRRYMDKYLISSKNADKKVKDFVEWQEKVIDFTRQVVYKIIGCANEALKNEHGEKEITDVVVLDHIVLCNIPDEMYKKRNDCLQKIAKGKGLDRLLSCMLLEDPDDDSTVTSRNPNGQEVLLEYERARAWQLAEQAQGPGSCGPSQKWTSYLARLRHAILTEAPAFFRTQFLINQIKEAVEAGNLEEGTAENPGMFLLAKELSASGGQSHQGENDYARAREVFRLWAVAGVQDAVKIADPFEILCRVSFLDLVFQMIAYTETRVEHVLDRTTPTAVARAVVERIGNVKGEDIRDDGMPDQRKERKRR